MTTSPSMPTTSVMWVMRREPSRRRAAWMMMSIEPTTISLIVLDGSAKPPMVIIDWFRDRASRGELAWTVPSAVVAGVHRLEQVEGLRPAHLADDDPFRSHAQAVPDEIAHGDLALALEIGRAGLGRTT